MELDPGGPKTYGSYGSGSATLIFTLLYFLVPGGGGGASGDGGLPVQGGGQAQHPQCRHQACSSSATTNAFSIYTREAQKYAAIILS